MAATLLLDFSKFFVFLDLGLFEAMSAIEIMDPKMDAGMICNRKRKVLQFNEAVKARAVCLSKLSKLEFVKMTS